MLVMGLQWRTTDKCMLNFSTQNCVYFIKYTEKAYGGLMPDFKGEYYRSLWYSLVCKGEFSRIFYMAYTLNLKDTFCLIECLLDGTKDLK